MIINNARICGKLKNIVIKDGVIERITDEFAGEGFDARGNEAFAGLIDVHTHGCIGFDTMDADFAPMCDFYAKNGTTSFLPTTMTMDYESLNKVVNAKTDFPGANILGFHFEGPYIDSKYKGAQPEEFIVRPDIDDLRYYQSISENVIKYITMKITSVII